MKTAISSIVAVLALPPFILPKLFVSIDIVLSTQLTDVYHSKHRLKFLLKIDFESWRNTVLITSLFKSHFNAETHDKTLDKSCTIGCRKYFTKTLKSKTSTTKVKCVVSAVTFAPNFCRLQRWAPKQILHPWLLVHEWNLHRVVSSARRHQCKVSHYFGCRSITRRLPRVNGKHLQVTVNTSMQCSAITLQMPHSFHVEGTTA